MSDSREIHSLSDVTGASLFMVEKCQPVPGPDHQVTTITAKRKIATPNVTRLHEVIHCIPMFVSISCSAFEEFALKLLYCV